MKLIDQLVASFKEQRPIRGGSLIMSIYGDAIEPRGGAVWLGSLINLLEPLGLNQRLVRTSIFRLTKDGWLSSDQVGRRSYYGITDLGQRRFESAFRRVYGEQNPEWSGEWDLLIISDIEAEQRKTLKKVLLWQGFAPISSSILAHPCADKLELQNCLREHSVLDKVVHMKSVLSETQSSIALKSLVKNSWDLQELAEQYGAFLARFRPILAQLNAEPDLDPQRCFLLRTLMIHQYRRIVLRDPGLPGQLLPSDWEGNAAKILCHNIYRMVYQRADEYLTLTQETANGRLPDADKKFFQRFGGSLLL